MSSTNPENVTPEELAASLAKSKAVIASKIIHSKQRQIDALNAEINSIAKGQIPDFHFLDHKVSTFWKCEKSPIGMCVWNLDEGGFHNGCHCRYCGDPVERK